MEKYIYVVVALSLLLNVFLVLVLFRLYGKVKKLVMFLKQAMQK